MHLDPQDEERLSAYLDGELSSDEQARVEQLLADEPAARQLLDELRAVSSTLQGLPRTRAPGDLATDVLGEIARRGVQRGAAQGSRTFQTAVAEAADSAGAEPARDGTNTTKPSAEPSLKPYVEAPVDWRGRLIRPLVYAGIAVAVFAAVSLMTERVGDVPVPVAQNPEEERAAGAERAETERVDKVEQWDATGDETDLARRSDEKLGKEDATRRSGMRPNSRFAAPAAASTQNGISDGAAQMAGQSQLAVQAADPRAFYFQQAVANGEPVLVVQCRVTPEAVRQDLVGKLLAKNMVAVDDEAAAELDTAINTNVGLGQAVMPTPDSVAPDSVVVQPNGIVEQSAMPFDEATPADAATEPEMPTDLARQQAPAQQSIAQDDSAPGADQATEGDRDNKVAAKHRGEPAFRNGELRESGEAASGGSITGADEPTVYLIDASPEQLEGVLADLKSQTEGVVSVMVSPAPEAPTQNDYLNYNRGAPPEALVVADDTAPLTESPAEAAAESAADPFTEPPAPAPASAPGIATAPAAAPAPAALPPMAPAASQIADQLLAVDESLQLGQHGRRRQRRVTNADEVRLQVQALGVLEEQLQNSPTRNEKLDRYGNASRARRLRPDTLSNFTPAPNAAALYGQAPALANQANQAAAVNAPPETNDAPAAGATAAQAGADVAQVAAPQNDGAQGAGAESSRMAAMRNKAGPRAGQMLQRAVIVLEVQPIPPAPAKKS